MLGDVGGQVECADMKRRRPVARSAENTCRPRAFAYLVLEQDRPEVVIRRRSGGWEAETVAGLNDILELPEIDVSVPMALIYGTP